LSTQLLEIGVASRPLVAAEESGDASLARVLPNGAMVGVVDAVGHGAEAAVVAREATALLAAAERAHPLTAVRLCHEGLRTSRGVVLSLAWFDPAAAIMTWLGVGNVAGLLVRSDAGTAPRQELLLLRNGVVGRQLPPLQAGVLPVFPGDTLVLATDGVDPAFMTRTVEVDDPETTAARILEAHATGLDDALVLVARYRGVPS